MKNEIVIKDQGIATRAKELKKIEKRVKELVQNHHEPSTQDSIKRAIKQYANYCNEKELSATSFSSLVEYIGFMSTKCKFTENCKNNISCKECITISKLKGDTRKQKHIKMKHSTIQKHVSHIRPHIKDINKDQLKVLMTGLQKTKYSEGRGKVMGKALTLDLLEITIKDINTKTLAGKRDKALLLCGFYGAFRISELINLRISDLTETEKGLTVLIRESKTDKENEGMYKYLPYTSIDMCPVRAIKEYIEANGTTEGYIFNGTSKNSTGSKISRQTAHRIMKKYNADFSCHSLRSGFVTSASHAGGTIQEIQQQTGHKTANMILHYTRSIDVTKNNAVNKLV